MKFPTRSAFLTVSAAISAAGMALLAGASMVSAQVTASTSASMTATTTATTTVTAVVTTVATDSTVCPVVTSFMKIGVPNRTSDVLKLQAFLSKHEGLDVQTSGIFDQKTELAVEAFQRKYTNDILGPWNATRPSGTVYITTAKKINQLVCGIPLSLDGKEMSTIASYRKAALAAAAQAAASGTSSTDVIVTGGGVGSSSGSDADLDNSASANRSSVMSRFWSFLASFFAK